MLEFCGIERGGRQLVIYGGLASQKSILAALHSFCFDCTVFSTKTIDKCLMKVPVTQFFFRYSELLVRGFHQEMAPKPKQSMDAFGVSAILGKKCTFAFG